MILAKLPYSDASEKNAGRKKTFPARSGWFMTRLDQPSATLACPNVHVSPEKVETTARDWTSIWLGWGICELIRLRNAVASSGEAHGRELKGKGTVRVHLSASEVWSHTTCQGREIIWNQYRIVVRRCSCRIHIFKWICYGDRWNLRISDTSRFPAVWTHVQSKAIDTWCVS